MRELTYNDKIIITSVALGVTTFAVLLYKFHAFRSIFTETIPNSVINNYNSISAGISQFLLELYSDSNLMSAYLTYFAVFDIFSWPGENYQYFRLYYFCPPQLP